MTDKCPLFKVSVSELKCEFCPARTSCAVGIKVTEERLTIFEVSFLLGLIANRLQEKPDCRPAQVIQYKLRKLLPKFIRKVLKE